MHQEGVLFIAIKFGRREKPKHINYSDYSCIGHLLKNTRHQIIIFFFKYTLKNSKHQKGFRL